MTTERRTRFQFIHFTPEMCFGLKVPRGWLCETNRDNTCLGSVDFGTWGQWCFNPEAGTEYSASCLRDIAEFIDSLKGTKP